MSRKENQEVVVGIVFYNESEKLKEITQKIKKIRSKYPKKFVFVDDGSTDGSSSVIKESFIGSTLANYKVIRKSVNEGVGSAIRTVIKYGLDNDYEVCAIMAGNGKDDVSEIDKILTPIFEEDFDYVQGSRFLAGGSYDNLPLYRKILIKGFTSIFYLFTGYKGTDSSDGFRAYKLSIFDDKRININQEWLDRYELETYLHYKVLSLGYKVKEVGVTKNYLTNVRSYTKMRPFLDWWKMAKPLFLLRFGLRR